MNKFIIRWVINAIALYIAVWLVPGVDLASGDWLSFIWLALIFGLLNALVRPLLVFLTCPLIVLTLGLGTLILNTVMLYLTQWVAGFFNIGFTLQGFWPAFLGALVISIVSVVLSLVIKDGGKKRK
ncbi:MAG TPA: phage holin family protein [Anaerolineales bacterium]|nr:phage holin family protein [Anaerolineales bacterium]